MKCPKCGHLGKANDLVFAPKNECPACGIIYNKLERTEHPQKKRLQHAGLTGHSSPVSAASLIIARERVERRLRKQQFAHQRDSRHIQTLELARRLTAEGVRQRQAEWERQNSKDVAHSPKEDNYITNQEHECESSHLLSNDMDSMGKLKQAAYTIAKAIKKKEKEPVNLSEAAQTEPTKKAPLSESHALPVQAADSTDPKNRHLDKKKTENKDCIRSSSGLVRLLPMVAWMILFTGVIGALLSWTTLANAQAGMRLPAATGFNSLPLGLLLGFAYLATGVLGFAFFWVSSLISRQLKDIKRLLLSQSSPRVEQKKDRQDY